MNTAQLIVLWYAGLLSVGAFLASAIESEASSLWLVAAIVLLAGITIYTLRSHPAARKRVVVASVLLPPLILGGALFTYLEYMSRAEARRYAAAEAGREAEERAEEARRRAADARFWEQIREGTPVDGRWVPVGVGADRARYLIDLQTIEVADPLLTALKSLGLDWVSSRNSDAAALRFWVKAADDSGAQRDMTHLTVACRGREMSPWAYTPGTIAEEVHRWAQQSKWCQDAVQAAAMAERTRAAPRPSVASAAGAQRTEDGRYAYRFSSGFSRVLVKVRRPLTRAEQEGLVGRLKTQCPNSWPASCSGRLDDGEPYSSEMLID